MKTGAAFAKGLLELEGDLPPILVSLVHKEKGSMHMLDPSGKSEQREGVRRRLGFRLLVGGCYSILTCWLLVTRNLLLLHRKQGSENGAGRTEERHNSQSSERH